MHIRPAKSTESWPVAELINLAMLEITYQFIGKEDLREANAFIAHFVEQEGNQYSYQNIFVAVEEDEIIGQICLYDGAELKTLRQPILNRIFEKYGVNYQAADETQVDEIYIDTFAVCPLAQGKGVGKQLLTFAIDYFAHQQKQTLGLLVGRDNPNAKRLYERLGFKVTNEVNIFGKAMDHMQHTP